MGARLPVVSPNDHSKPRQGRPRGGGGASPRFLMPTTPPTNYWPEAPWGGGGGDGRGGGPRGANRGVLGGAWGGGGSGRVGWGGSRWGDLGWWWGMDLGGVIWGVGALGGHKLPLPPLALYLIIPSR